MRLPFPIVTFFEESIEIDAPLEDVFARLVDVARWPEWASGVKSSVAHVPPFSRGERFTFTPKVAMLSLTPTVLAYGPNRFFAWGRERLGSGVEHRFELVDLRGGRTRLDQHEFAFGAGVPLFVVARGTIAKFDRRFAEDLQRSFTR